MVQQNKILIVEDETINAISLRMALKRLGYTFCELVSTGEQAVRVAEQENPDLVIMDINLAGEMDGIKAAEIIRSQRDVPIIFLTGYTDEKIIEKVSTFGNTVCIIKPTDPDEVCQAVEKLLTEQ